MTIMTKIEQKTNNKVVINKCKTTALVTTTKYHGNKMKQGQKQQKQFKKKQK